MSQRRLGLRYSTKTNLAFMMKLNWIFCSRPNTLWVKVLKAKYKCGEGLIPSFIKPKNCSNVWRGICATSDFINLNIFWRIGDGKSVKFWADN